MGDFGTSIPTSPQADYPVVGNLVPINRRKLCTRTRNGRYPGISM